jgi:ribose transport system permease protein
MTNESLVEKLSRRFENNPVFIYFRNNIGILSALLIMFVLMSILSEYFLTIDNWFNILRQISLNMMLAAGVMLAIIIGGIDLTCGSIVALCGCTSAVLIQNGMESVVLAVLIGCFIGWAVGAANGCIVAYTGMPPFIVTLAMMSICRGAAYLVANGQPVRIPNVRFQSIGTGYIGSIPLPAIYIVFLMVILFLLLNKAKVGRHIYAVGGNIEAARFSGVKTKRVQILVYSLSGLFAGFAGIMLAARMASGQPAVGLAYETDAIAAAVLGGTSMTGGIGTIGGMFIGALVLGVVSNGLNLLHVNSFWQYVAKGGVILIAVYIDMFRKRKDRV